MSARSKVLALAVLLPASTVQAQDAYRYGYVRTVEQGVTLQRASEAAAEVATPNMPFLPGDRIWTDEAGRMEVVFADGSVLRLDSRSKLDYVAQESGRRERVVLRLWSGALILHVRDDRRSPEFVVESPEGVMETGDRGVYRLDVQPGEARVVVLGGEATVEAGRRVDVDEGEQLIVREGEPYAGPERISGYDADDAFARWDREQQDQLAYAEGRREEYLPEELAPYGSEFASDGTWRMENTYGHVWYPRVSAGWAPYSQGHWAWTPYGWTWIPVERWGWATSHYGRWGYSNGWFWIPGRSWGPAWVSWSVGGDHVGWCPLGWGDRPVNVPGSYVKGYAVPRGRARADNYPWTYVRRADMGQRDLARRRVDPAQLATSELRVGQVGYARLSRDLRLVHGSGTGSVAPALQADPRITIRRPVPRRQRDPEATADQGAGGDEQKARPAPRVSVPRIPAAPAPFALPQTAAPRQDRPAGEGTASTGQGGERDNGRREGGDRDRDILRPIFGPLSRPRTDENASRNQGLSGGDSGSPRNAAPPPWVRPRPDRGGQERSGSDGERTRPAGVSSTPKATAPPPSPAPAEQRPQTRERARPRDREN